MTIAELRARLEHERYTVKGPNAFAVTMFERNPGAGAWIPWARVAELLELLARESRPPGGQHGE